MFRFLKQSFLKTIVLYQGVSGIVLGILCLSYAGFMMVNVPKTIVQRIHTNDIYFYHFLLWVSMSSILKGFLLLMAALRENKILLVVYLIWTTLVLLLSKAFVVRAGIQMKKQIEQIRAHNDSHVLKNYESSFTYYFYVYYPLVFVFGWLLQFCAVLFFLNLIRTAKNEPVRKEEERISMSEVKNDIEIV